MSMPKWSRSTRTVLGCSCGLGRLPALIASTWPAVWRRSRASAIGERALLPVQTNSTVRRGSRWWTGAGQRVGAAVQVQVVVAVAAVEAAAGGGDQATVAQQPQVVGDQVLRMADQCDQLTDPQVAAGEFGQQPPAQRVSGEAYERRGGLTRQAHDPEDTSNRFDRSRLARRWCGASAAEVQVAVALDHFRPPEWQYPSEHPIAEAETGHLGEHALRPAHHPAAVDVVGRPVPRADQAAAIINVTTG